MDDVTEFPCGRKPYASGTDRAQGIVAIQPRPARVSVRVLPMPDSEERHARRTLARMVAAGEYAPNAREEADAERWLRAVVLRAREAGRAAA